MSPQQQPPSPNHSFQPLISEEPYRPEITTANLVADPQPTSSPPKTTTPTSSAPLNSTNHPETPPTAPFPSDSSILLTPSPSPRPSSSCSDTASLAKLTSDSSDSSFQPTSPPPRLRRTNRQTRNSRIPVRKGKKTMNKTAQEAKRNETTRKENPRAGSARERKWRLDREDWRLIKGAKRHGDGGEERRKKRRRS